MGQHFRNSREAGESHHSHVQVDNPMSITGGCLNVARTVAPQKVFSHTNSMVQPGVYDEPLPSTKVSGAP